MLEPMVSSGRQMVWTKHYFGIGVVVLSEHFNNVLGSRVVDLHLVCGLLYCETLTLDLFNQGFPSPQLYLTVRSLW